MALTWKQEAFCQAMVKGANQTDAYKSVYDASKMKANVINVKACELLKNGKVSVRLKELQDAIAKRHELTVDDIIAELEEAREMARSASTPNPGVMVNATMGKAKVAGLIKDKHELTGKDGAPIEVTRIERVIIDTKK